MSDPITEQLEIFTRDATESAVVVELCDLSRGRIRAFHGELRGPRCRKAKTLQATFVIDRCECETAAFRGTSLVVTEPCYWTPELPMLYDLKLELELADGTATTWQKAVGLRRWETHGRDLFREEKRVVLRGMLCEDFTLETLAPAAEAEVVLVVHDPESGLLFRAGELGVPLVVDLRGFEGDLTRRLLRLARQPAVVMVLMEDELAGNVYRPHEIRIGGVCGDAKPQAAGTDSFDVLVFELDTGGRPPQWAATCAKPVIAIRRVGAYADLSAARQGCDRLQAELAPEFDLAGYFV